MLTPSPIPYNHEDWLKRVRKSAWLAAIIASVSLVIGVCGYHFIGHLGWVDAILEASMILGGMGPVATMSNDAMKLFASAYALYSGLVLLTTTGIIISPWLQRLIHHPHHKCERESSKNKRS